jgi:hypothetical protein
LNFRIDAHNHQEAAGTLVLGDIPKDLCTNDWRYLKTVSNENATDWMVRVDG